MITESSKENKKNAKFNRAGSAHPGFAMTTHQQRNGRRRRTGSNGDWLVVREVKQHRKSYEHPPICEVFPVSCMCITVMFTQANTGPDSQVVHICDFLFLFHNEPYGWWYVPGAENMVWSTRTGSVHLEPTTRGWRWVINPELGSSCFPQEVQVWNTAVSYNRKNLQSKKKRHFSFSCIFLIDLSPVKRADLNTNHIRASGASPGVLPKPPFSKPDVFGLLTISSCTCHTSCPASETQPSSRNLVTDPVPRRAPRSHADCCSELFMSGREEGGFRVTVHPSPRLEPPGSVPLPCSKTREKLNWGFDTS